MNILIYNGNINDRIYITSDPFVTLAHISRDCDFNIKTKPMTGTNQHQYTKCHRLRQPMNILI